MRFQSLLMKFWLPIKIWLVTKKYGKRETTWKEVKAVRKFMQKNNLWEMSPKDFKILNYLAYKKDGWLDLQKPAYKTLNDWGGDCEDLHRVAQIVIYFLLHNKKVYLLQAIGTKSHAMVGYEHDGKKYIYDYDSIMEVQTLRTGAKVVMLRRYGAKIDYVFITNLNWDIVKDNI